MHHIIEAEDDILRQERAGFRKRKSYIVTSLAIGWITMSITHGIKQGLQWALTWILEDLDYADDLGFVPSRRHYI